MSESRYPSEEECAGGLTTETIVCDEGCEFSAPDQLIIECGGTKHVYLSIEEIRKVARWFDESE